METWLLLLLTMLNDPPRDAGAPKANPWPCRISVSREGPRLIPELWTGSATFRGQCQSIAEHGLVVVVRWADDMTLDHRAETQILRERGRVFRAVVSLGATDEPAVQLVHELEHVLEALEGKDVTRPGIGRRTRGGAYETIRAREVEHRARRELREGQRTAPLTASH